MNEGPSLNYKKKWRKHKLALSGMKRGIAFQNFKIQKVSCYLSVHQCVYESSTAMFVCTPKPPKSISLLSISTCFKGSMLTTKTPILSCFPAPKSFPSHVSHVCKRYHQKILICSNQKLKILLLSVGYHCISSMPMLPWLFLLPSPLFLWISPLPLFCPLPQLPSLSSPPSDLL